MTGPAEVYASEGTRNHFGPGLMDRFGVYAGTQGVQKILIIAPEDVFGTDSPDSLTDEQKTQRFKEYVERQAGFPAGAFDPHYETLARNSADRSAMAQAVDMDGDGQNDVAIILGQPRSQTAQGMAAQLSRLPAESLGNIPGTDRDWQAFVIMHEIGHVDQPDKDNQRNLVWEVEAEQDAQGFYADAARRGLVSDPAVGHAHTQMRSLSTFYWKNDLYTHVIGAGVMSGDEGPAPSADVDTDLADPLHKARSLVAHEAGRDLVSTEDLRKAAQGMSEREGVWRYVMDADRVYPTETEREMFRQIENGSLSVEQGLAGLEPDRQRIYRDYFDGVANPLGIKALREDPQLMFETTRRLYLTGKFDDNPIGKQYAYEFLEAARTNAPDYFGVTNREERFTPPVFPEARSQTPTGVPSHEVSIDRVVRPPGP